jgi:acyl-CoA synthetase (NDP forming)/RimJ/RimL family protein N-acetyltransferase
VSPVDPVEDRERVEAREPVGAGGSAPAFPPGYPVEFELDVVLTDGRTAHVRPVRPDDAERLVRFHTGLSLQSRYYRYFSAHPKLTAKEIHRVTHVDYQHRFALVALLDDDLLAIAGYEGDHGDGRAEVAFTVDDTHQGRGLSTLLLEHLAVAARGRGITTFTAMTLPDNRAMLTVFKRAGYTVSSRFNEGVVELEFDIAMTDDVASVIGERERRADVSSMTAVLQPRRVAVVGSFVADGVGAALARTLLAHDPAVPVHLVSAAGGSLGGVAVVGSLRDLPEPVDLVFAAVSDGALDAVIEDAAANGARALVVLAEGVAPERCSELVADARSRGMRLLGPASLGVLLPDPGLRVHGVPIDLEVRHGGLALSSQAGPFGAGVVEDGARVGLGFAAAVFVGDRADVAGIDLLQAWELDDRVRCIAVAVDRFGDPAKFARVVRRVSAVKPVVALWGGEGVHRETVDGLFGQAGVLPVPTYEQLVDTCRVLVDAPVVAGDRVAVVADTPAAARTFRAALTRTGLGEVTVHDWPAPEPAPAPGPGTAGTAGTLAGLASRIVGDGADADVIVVIRAPVRREPPGPLLEAVRAAAGGRPVVAVTTDPPGRAGGVPTFRSPHAAAAAVHDLLAYGQRRRRHVALPVHLDDIDRAAVAAVLERARLGSGELGWEAAAELCGALGITVAPTVLADTPAQAAAAARALGGPLVLKTVGLPELAPGEEGGAALDLHDPDDVAAAAGRLLARFGPAALPLCVQRQVPVHRQFEVSLRSDPVFGPVVGVLPGRGPSRHLLPSVERLVPLLDLDADALVAEERITLELGGSAADTAALRLLVLRMAALGEAHPGTELRLHPVLIGDGVARVAWAGGAVAAPRSPERPRGLPQPPTADR